jgi:RNA polymerase sigma factor (sigma-70 family)
MAALTRDRTHWVARELLPHEPALRAWLGRRVRPPLEVDDIVQETYAVLGALDTVEHIRSPRSYMFQTAYTLLVAQIRRAHVVSFDSLVELEGLEIASDRPSPEDEVSARTELQKMKALIAALPGRQRDAFTLFKVEGLAQKEIARSMGISQKTVENHLARAVAALMIALGPGGQPFEIASRSLRSSSLAKPSRARNQLTD